MQPGACARVHCSTSWHGEWPSLRGEACLRTAVSTLPSFLKVPGVSGSCAMLMRLAKGGWRWLELLSNRLPQVWPAFAGTRHLLEQGVGCLQAYHRAGWPLRVMLIATEGSKLFFPALVCLEVASASVGLVRRPPRLRWKLSCMHSLALRCSCLLE